MKTLLTTLMTCSTLIAGAQIKISEKSVDIEGSKNGFFIEIPYGTDKEVDKALKQELKTWKGSFSSKKTYFIDDCKNKKMGENTFDVYATVEGTSTGGGNVLVAIDLGGAFLSSSAHKDQFSLMEGILYEFAVAVAKDVIQGEVELEEGVLKTKEKELSDLEKEQEKLLKEIEEYKKQITANELAVETSKKNQETKKEEIKVQQGVVQEKVKKKEAVK